MVATDFRKVTVTNGMGLYDVMSASHDKLYPHSRRQYSRPFSSYQVSHAQNPRAEFFNAILEIGEDFIGDPFDFNLNADKRSGWFSPPGWHERTIISYLASDDFKNLPVSDDVRNAYMVIENEIVRVTKDESSHQYDTTLLRPAFETIWQNDWMIDPRLTVAEKIFFNFPHSLNCEFSSLRHADQIERFRDSMIWMMQPENAERVARAFLYSRIAQHLGETSPEVAAQAAEIHEALKNDVTDTFVPRGIGRDAGGLLSIFRNMFEDEKITTLRDSWSQIASDHKWIRTGKFARYAYDYAQKTTPSLQPL